jgi:hypothetical protein
VAAVKDPNRDFAAANTDALGIARLELDAWVAFDPQVDVSVSVTAAKYLPGSGTGKLRRGQTLTIPVQLDPHQLDPQQVRLGDAGVLNIKVIDESQQPVTGAVVIVANTPISNVDNPPTNDGLRQLQRFSQKTTGPDGMVAFVISDDWITGPVIIIADVYVRVRAAGYLQHDDDVRVVLNTQTTHTVRLRRDPSGNAIIRGRVTYRDVPADADIRVLVRERPYPTEIRRGPGGTFTIQTQTPRLSLEQEPYTIFASRQIEGRFCWGMAEAGVPPDASVEIRLRCDWLADSTLAGHAEFPPGVMHPLPGWPVRLAMLGPTPRDPAKPTVRTDDGGNYVFTKLPAGLYRVRIQGPEDYCVEYTVFLDGLPPKTFSDTFDHCSGQPDAPGEPGS